jgi:hypothetical protein
LAFHVRERDARKRERKCAQAEAEQAKLRLLSTTIPGEREWLPLLCELSAYELGADSEAPPEVLGDKDAGEYLQRDQDEQLRRALADARAAQMPQLVLLHGEPKAGKSRTLYEVVSQDEELREALVIAPGPEDLGMLLESDWLPALPLPGRVLFWLDDREDFLTAGKRGTELLDKLAAWSRPVLVVATAGGRGAKRQGPEIRLLPIQDVLADYRRVRVVWFSGDLSDDEKRRVRARYPTDVADQIVRTASATTWWPHPPSRTSSEKRKRSARRAPPSPGQQLTVPDAALARSAKPRCAGVPQLVGI